MVEIAAVGDVYVDRPTPGDAFRHVSGIFHAANIAFGNCEGVHTASGSRNPIAWGAMRGSAAGPAAMAAAGFTVMSFANNHALDWGFEAFDETVKELRNNDIAVVGAGSNDEEAFRPVVRTVDGVRVGFVAATCVFPPGFEAGPGKPGCATIGIHASYEGEMGQPGTKSTVATFPDWRDLLRFEDTVRHASAACDILVVSVHWGIHNEPGVIADYERIVARSAVRAGASVVLGHHQHILQGVDIVEGRPVFHGLGNFVFDLRIDQLVRPEIIKRMVEAYGVYGTRPRRGYPTYPFHPDARQTVVVRLTVSKKGIDRVTVLPCLIQPDGSPRPLSDDKAGGERVLGHLLDVADAAGLHAELRWSKGAIEVVL